jgi:hypothetical protein
LLRGVYGEDTLSRAHVFEWHRRFLGKREDVEDDERPGRPVTMTTDENVDKVRTLVRNDRRRIECGQRNSKTNFNRKFKDEKSVCQDISKQFERRSETEQGRDVSKRFVKN